MLVYNRYMPIYRFRKGKVEKEANFISGGLNTRIYMTKIHLHIHRIYRKYKKGKM